MTELADTLAHLERLAESRRQAGRARAERIGGLLPAAARRLRGYGAERVLLFGSMASGEPGPSADVDLAVWGLPAVHHFRALAELMELLEVPVDLVRLEEAPQSLRERVDFEGREL
jgi:predicted nucleotidyltransferase